jgi:hypothetical protein
MEKKRKRPLRTPEERERQRYNLELFRQVLAKRMEQDGQSPEEIRRRLGDLSRPLL